MFYIKTKCPLQLPKTNKKTIMFSLVFTNNTADCVVCVVVGLKSAVFQLNDGWVTSIETKIII